MVLNGKFNEKLGFPFTDFDNVPFDDRSQEDGSPSRVAYRCPSQRVLGVLSRNRSHLVQQVGGLGLGKTNWHSNRFSDGTHRVTAARFTATGAIDVSSITRQLPTRTSLVFSLRQIQNRVGSLGNRQPVRLQFGLLDLSNSATVPSIRPAPRRR